MAKLLAHDLHLFFGIKTISINIDINDKGIESGLVQILVSFIIT